MDSTSSYIAENIRDCTIQFARIIGLEGRKSYADINAGLYTSREKIETLSHIFSIFDGLCEKCHVEKIKTIENTIMFFSKQQRMS